MYNTINGTPQAWQNHARPPNANHKKRKMKKKGGGVNHHRSSVFAENLFLLYHLGRFLMVVTSGRLLGVYPLCGGLRLMVNDVGQDSTSSPARSPCPRRRWPRPVAGPWAVGSAHVQWQSVASVRRSAEFPCRPHWCRNPGRKPLFVNKKLNERVNE